MSFPDFALYIILPALMLGILITLVRLVRGPRMPDRVVALDLLSTLGIGVIAVFSMATDTPVFLDAAMILALVSFLGTVAFANYLQRRS